VPAPARPLKPFQVFLESLREVVAQVKASGVEVKTVERVDRPERKTDEWHVTAECDTCGHAFKQVLVPDAAGKLPGVTKPDHACADLATIFKPKLRPR
jgi:hypothetical protein